MVESADKRREEGKEEETTDRVAGSSRLRVTHDEGPQKKGKDQR